MIIYTKEGNAAMPSAKHASPYHQAQGVGYTKIQQSRQKKHFFKTNSSTSIKKIFSISVLLALTLVTGIALGYFTNRSSCSETGRFSIKAMIADLGIGKGDWGMEAAGKQETDGDLETSGVRETVENRTTVIRMLKKRFRPEQKASKIPEKKTGKPHFLMRAKRNPVI